jgi:hypothetical protein
VQPIHYADGDFVLQALAKKCFCLGDRKQWLFIFLKKDIKKIRTFPKGIKDLII